MVLSASEYLDEETILKKLPFITVDEVKDILSRKDAEDMDRFGTIGDQKRDVQITGEGSRDEENETAEEKTEVNGGRRSQENR